MKVKSAGSRWLLLLMGVLLSALVAGCGGGGGAAGISGLTEGSRITDTPSDNLDSPPAPPTFGDQQGDIENPPAPPSP